MEDHTTAPLMPVAMQAANAFFLASALFSDVLLIRLCLSAAFLCLLVQCCISADQGLWVVDGFIWAIGIGLFHWRASFVLLKEEITQYKFTDDDEHALFCYLHRRTGLMEGDFARILASGSWRRAATGEQICDTVGARASLFVLVQGTVKINFRNERISGRHDAAAHQTTLGSGECFDLRVLNSCGVFIGFPNEHFVASCHNGPCLCFELPVQSLVTLFQEHVQMVQFFRTLSLTQLARFVGLRAEFAIGEANFGNDLSLPLDSFGQLEDSEWLQGSRSRDFAPLTEAEAKCLQWSWSRGWKWLLSSFNSTVSPGIRNQSNPYSGSLAQASVVSLSRAGLTELRGKVAAKPTEIVSDPLVADELIEL